MTILSSAQAQRAVQTNERRFYRVPEQGWYIEQVRRKIGASSGSAIDEDFVQALAVWQRDHPAQYATRPLRVDGSLSPRTEAHLGIVLPKMQRLVEIVERYHREGGVLFDSWGNDFRDNDNDGLVDERDEWTNDGAHYGRVYDGFQIGPPQNPETAHSAGWSRDRDVHGIPRVVQPVDGRYRYMMCSDLVSDAMIEARIIRQRGRTADLIRALLPPVAYVFRRSEDYPEEFLPGDYIATWRAGEGGHSAVVVERAQTNGGSAAATVIELPGPSTMTEQEIYRPGGIHTDPGRPAGVRGDVVRGPWPHFRRADGDRPFQYLVRLVHSRLGRIW